MASPRTVDEMIMSLPRNEQVMVKRLRTLVQECLPMAVEKPYYGLGIPFYSRHRQICYIMPASALCEEGNPITTKSKECVSLCFCQGNRMSNEDGVLAAEGRKQVYVMYFKSLRDIHEDQVRALLFEAAMVDDTFSRERDLPRRNH